MANFKKHAAVGAAVGCGVNLLWQLCKIQTRPNAPVGILNTLAKVNLLEVGVFTLFGAVAGILPDLLEPATNPNHRKFFHSMTCGAAVAHGAFGSHTKNWNPENRHAVQLAALSYASHLLLDGSTPKGLPLV